MPSYNREHAKRAISSGTILVLCLRSVGNPDNTLFDKYYLALTNEFIIMGVDIKLDELKRLNRIEKEEIILIVRNIKLRIINAIESSCGSTVSGWFQLSLSLALTVHRLTATALTFLDRTSVIAADEEDLRSAAVRAGYAESKLDTILRRLQTEYPPNVLGDFVTEAFEIVETPHLFISHANADDKLAEELATTVIQYYSLFIAYANLDETLARRLYKDLQNKGVRCWMAPYDLRPGDYHHRRIDEAIHVHEKVLLLLSEHAVNSSWVMHEVQVALAREICHFLKNLARL